MMATPMIMTDVLPLVKSNLVISVVCATDGLILGTHRTVPAHQFVGMVL